MEVQEQINYKRIAEAIEYIRVNFKEQPDLDDVAKKVHVSPFHFQRLFTAWAGVSPKKFLQFTTIDYAKSILKDGKISPGPACPSGRQYQIGPLNPSHILQQAAGGAVG